MKKFSVFNTQLCRLCIILYIGSILSICGDKKADMEMKQNRIKKAEIFNTTGLKMYQIKKYKDAIENFDHAAKIDPENAEYPNNTAMAYLASRNTKKAIEYFKKAIRLNPNGALYHYNRGLAYQSINDLNNALKNYEKSIELDKTHQASLMQAATVLIKKEDFPKAEKYLLQSIDTRDNAAARAMIGALYLNQNKLADAEENLQKSVSLNNTVYLPYYNLGVIAQKRNEYKKAINHYNSALKLDSRYYPAYFNLGLMHKKLNQHKKAIEALNKYINLLPPNMIVQKRDAYKLIQALNQEL